MSIPRGRVVTLSPYQPRQVLPVAIHRGDVLDVSIKWTRLLRSGETPDEVINAANVSSQGVSISDVEYAGKYLNFTVSGAQADGEAKISMAISTTLGRTISRSLRVPTVWEDAVINAVTDPEPPAGNDFFITVGWEDSQVETRYWGYGQYWLNPEEEPTVITGGDIDHSTIGGTAIIGIMIYTFYEETTPDTFIMLLAGNLEQSFFQSVTAENIGIFSSGDAFFSYDSVNNVSKWEWGVNAPTGTWEPIGGTKLVAIEL
jgi:hypothetical protein